MQENSQNKSVIFLDFDGVLNTGNSPYRDEFGDLFDPASVHELKKYFTSAWLWQFNGLILQSN